MPSPPDHPRAARVAELIQVELADLLLREAKDPRLRGVLITRVEVSPDLRQARVHFSRYDEARGSDEEVEEGRRGLEKCAGFLQGKLYERLQTKRVPRLRFFPDRSMAYSDHIERLLRGLRREGGAGEEA